jgi:hypothetical protein
MVSFVLLHDRLRKTIARALWIGRMDQSAIKASTGHDVQSVQLQPQPLQKYVQNECESCFRSVIFHSHESIVCSCVNDNKNFGASCAKWCECYNMMCTTSCGRHGTQRAAMLTCASIPKPLASPTTIATGIKSSNLQMIALLTNSGCPHHPPCPKAGYTTTTSEKY